MVALDEFIHEANRTKKVVCCNTNALGKYSNGFHYNGTRTQSDLHLNYNFDG